MSQSAAFKKTLKRLSNVAKKRSGKQSYTEVGSAGLPTDVPKGHFVVYVGPNRIRYVLSMSYLTRPEFQVLLSAAEEEFGFGHESGLTIPCEEHVFHSLVSVIGRGEFN